MYTVVFRIKNCRLRNIASEALEVFRGVMSGHIENIRHEFSVGYFKTIGTLV